MEATCSGVGRGHEGGSPGIPASGRGNFLPVVYRQRTFLIRDTLGITCKTAMCIHLCPSLMAEQENIFLAERSYFIILIMNYYK